MAYDYQSPLLKSLLKISRYATRHIHRDYAELDLIQSSKSGTYKFATQSELKIKKLLIEDLIRLKPNASIIGIDEEYVKSDSEHRFIIIPMDGFINFSHAIPLFATVIAYQKLNLQGNYETQAVVVDAPILRECFFTEKGTGSWKETYADSATSSSRLRVSERKMADEILAASNKPYRSQNANYYSNLFSNSNALNTAYFAAGRLDLIELPTNYSFLGLMAIEAGGTLVEQENYSLYKNSQVNI